MRHFSQKIVTIIEESGLNLHNISQASGVSNPYLAKLVKGKINRPGKAKLSSILFALSYTVTDINKILSDYDYQPLHREDIHDLLENNRARRIVGGNLPQYDGVHLDLLLVSLEHIGGVKILTKERPSGVFMPHEFYLMKEFPYETNSEAAQFRYILTEALLEERSQLFLSNINSGSRSDTYICTECLRDYLNQHLHTTAQKEHPRTTLLVTRYFANALSLAIKRPELYRMYMMERCPYFQVMIQDAEGPSPKTLFPGRKPHSFNNGHDRRHLEGITTDASHLLNHVRHEIDRCSKAVLEGFRESYPESIKSYIFKAFDNYGLASSLEKELDFLMQRDEIYFH